MASSKKKAARKLSPARDAAKPVARKPASNASARAAQARAAEVSARGGTRRDVAGQKPAKPAARSLPPRPPVAGTKAAAAGRTSTAARTALAKTAATNAAPARSAPAKPVQPKPGVPHQPPSKAVQAKPEAAKPVQAKPVQARRVEETRAVATPAPTKAPAKPEVAAAVAAAAPAPNEPSGRTQAPRRAARVAGARGKKPRAGERAVPEDGAPGAVPGLSEEDQIRAAKYLPRELPKRVFDEERFLFPESYGLNRIRLLVRDPEWIFAYWDVNPEAMKDLGRKLGERALALSRLTLRVVDPVSGASSDILLPPGARWWYVRTDSARRTYRAELGVTLPSGAFHGLAQSNTVVTPRVGPSAERARRRVSYPESRAIPLSAAQAALAADQRSGVAQQPWPPGSVEGAAEPVENERERERVEAERKGGASDAFRSGASDAFRR